MPEFERDSEVLIHLGLNKSQAIVYTTLCNCGKSNAQTIWKMTNVARQDIYRILKELQKAGLVEKIITIPAQYQATPISEAVSMLFQQKKNELIKLRTEALEVEETRRSVQKPTYSDKYEFTIIPKELLDRRIDQTFDRTQRSISVFSTLRVLSITLTKERYANAIMRGLHVRVIVNTQGENRIKLHRRLFWRRENFEIRYLDDFAPAAFSLFDQRESYIYTNTEAKWLGADCFWTSYPAITLLLEKYFELHWSMAKLNLEQKPLMSAH